MESFFKSRFGIAPTVIARAPGRLEFIGNHLDYNGGPVLGAAIDKYVTVAVAPRTDRKIALVSQSMKGVVELTLDEVAPVTGENSWVNYPLGMFSVLRDAGMKAGHGFDLAVTNDLPMGAGLSSSAAIELATGYALSALFGYKLDTKAMAELGRKAENTFVGMPCGILDQGCSAFGKAEHLVHIDCAVNAFATVPMPAGTHFWVFNSQKKHALIDSYYSTRFKECAESFAILKRRNPALVNLAAATEAEVIAAREELGADRLHRALHVVRETARVNDTVAALKSGDTARVGRNLTASHGSSRDWFGNSCAELDFLVAQVAVMPGVYGARLSGGGFGGAIMALTDGSFTEASAAKLVADYEMKFGHKPTIFHTKTGDGAGVVG